MAVYILVLIVCAPRIEISQPPRAPHAMFGYSYHENSFPCIKSEFLVFQLSLLRLDISPCNFHNSASIFLYDFPLVV